MNWELMDLIGRLILCTGIIASALLFITVNVNYLPKAEEETEEDHEDN